MERAAVHGQRVARGRLCRGFGKDVDFKARRMQMVKTQGFLGCVAATVAIQAVARGIDGRGRAGNRKWWLRYDSAVRIQALARAVAARAVAFEIRANNTRMALMNAILLMQSRVRGWKGRARAQTRAKHLATTASRARETVELDVNQRLLRLAHRYLKSGDLWSFVAAVDADYKRFEADERANADREDAWAKTFVDKVLKTRDADHAEAWAKFINATRSPYFPKPDNDVDLVPGPRLRLLLDGVGADGVTPEMEASAAAAAAPKEAGRRRRALIAGAYEDPRDKSSAPHGPGVHQSSSATAVTSTPSLQRQGSSLQRQPSSPSLQRQGSSPSLQRQGSTPSLQRQGSSPSLQRQGSSLSASPKRRESALQAALERSATSARHLEPKKSAVASWKPARQPESLMGRLGVAARNLRESRARVAAGEDDERAAIDDDSTPAGLSALTDVPGGLDDTLPRLLRAAALRTYVPRTFRGGTTAREAFATYRAMPPSLVKSKHEVDAHRAVARWITALQVAGFRTIRSLLPPRRARETILSLEDWVRRNVEGDDEHRPEEAVDEAMMNSQLAARPLGDNVRDLLNDLHQVSRADLATLAGLGKNKTAAKWRALERGEMTAAQAVDAARRKAIKRLRAYREPEPDGDDEDAARDDEPPDAPEASIAGSDFLESESTLYTPRGQAEERALLEDRRTTPLDYAIAAEAEAIRSPARDARAAANIPPLVPEDRPEVPSPRGAPAALSARSAKAAVRLEDDVERKVWDDIKAAGGLGAKVGVFLARAAFLCVGDFDGGPEGGAAFTNFIRRLSAAEDDDEERSIMRERAARAGAASKKVVANLDVVGAVGLSKDLAYVNLREWGASESLADRAERMLGVLSAPRSTSVRGERNDAVDGWAKPPESRGLRETGPNAVKDPRKQILRLSYDPRYQRGPFDPYGRPHRIAGATAPRTRPPQPDPDPPPQFGSERDDAPYPPRVFAEAEGGGNPSNPAVVAASQIAKRRAPPTSIEPQELVPLHLMPQEFVGAAHRSRKLTKRIHARASNYFAEYGVYVQQPQLGRDESREAFEARMGAQPPPEDPLTDLERAALDADSTAPLLARQQSLPALSGGGSKLFDDSGSFASLHTERSKTVEALPPAAAPDADPPSKRERTKTTARAYGGKAPRRTERRTRAAPRPRRTEAPKPKRKTRAETTEDTLKDLLDKVDPATLNRLLNEQGMALTTKEKASRRPSVAGLTTQKRPPTSARPPAAAPAEVAVPRPAVAEAEAPPPQRGRRRSRVAAAAAPAPAPKPRRASVSRSPEKARRASVSRSPDAAPKPRRASLSASPSPSRARRASSAAPAPLTKPAKQRRASTASTEADRPKRDAVLAARPRSRSGVEAQTQTSARASEGRPADIPALDFFDLRRPPTASAYTNLTTASRGSSADVEAFRAAVDAERHTWYDEAPAEAPAAAASALREGAPALRPRNMVRQKGPSKAEAKRAAKVRSDAAAYLRARARRAHDALHGDLAVELRRDTALRWLLDAARAAAGDADAFLPLGAAPPDARQRPEVWSLEGFDEAVEGVDEKTDDDAGRPVWDDRKGMWVSSRPEKAHVEDAEAMIVHKVRRGNRRHTDDDERKRLLAQLRERELAEGEASPYKGVSYADDAAHRRMAAHGEARHEPRAEVVAEPAYDAPARTRAGGGKVYDKPLADGRRLSQTAAASRVQRENEKHKAKATTPAPKATTPASPASPPAAPPSEPTSPSSSTASSPGKKARHLFGWGRKKKDKSPSPAKKAAAAPPATPAASPPPPAASPPPELKRRETVANASALLANPRTAAAVKAFLDKEYATENYLALDAIAAFRRTAADGGDVAAAARALYDEFIDQSSETQVNISGKLLRQLKRRIVDGEGDPVDAAVFDKVRVEIDKMLTGNLMKHRGSISKLL